MTSPELPSSEFEQWLLEILKRVLEDQSELKALVCDSLAVPSQQRAAFLLRACQDDVERMRQVLGWLAVYDMLTATFGRLQQQLRDFDSFLE